MSTIVISLGGSIINSGEIHTKFLTNFRNIILNYCKKNTVIIVTGGGKTAREYQSAAARITKVADIDLDWIGISATKINAELIRSIFNNKAHPEVIDNPTTKISHSQPIIIGSGWKPGCSSDKDAVLLAENFQADTVINMTNVKYVYDKDPKKHKDARPIRSMTWKEMFKLVGTKWQPGANLPFDPVATKKAAELGLRVVILNNDLENFQAFLNNLPFIGTVIS